LKRPSIHLLKLSKALGKRIQKSSIFPGTQRVGGILIVAGIWRNIGQLEVW